MILSRPVHMYRIGSGNVMKQVHARRLAATVYILLYEGTLGASSCLPIGNYVISVSLFLLQMKLSNSQDCIGGKAAAEYRKFHENYGNCSICR